MLGNDLNFDALEAIRRLGERQIGTRPFFYPMHQQPVFLKMGLFHGVSCPVSERIAERGFYLPSGLALTEGEIETVSAVFKETIK